MANGRILSGMIPPMDPGNLAFFSRVYPTSILVNMRLDGMKFGAFDYQFYGDSIGFNPGLPVTDISSFHITGTAMSSYDSIGLKNVLSDSNVMLIYSKGIEIYFYKHFCSLPGIFPPVDRQLIIITNSIASSDEAIERFLPLQSCPILNVSPNPFNTSTLLRYSLPAPANGNLEIFSADGKRLLLEKISGSNHYLWNASYLSQGIYFCRITCNKIQYMKRLILLR